MSKIQAGTGPAEDDDGSASAFGLDALLDASIAALVAIVNRALASIAGQHAEHLKQLAVITPRDATEVVRTVGKAALKAAKEHAGTSRMSKASAAREARAASATYANALAALSTAGERAGSMAMPSLMLVVAAARLQLALAQYGNGPFTLNEPKARKPRADGVVKRVEVADLSQRERELIVDAVEADETNQVNAHRALRSYAVARNSAPLQQVCALIDIDDRKRLNKLCTAIKRVGTPTSAPVKATTGPKRNELPRQAQSGSSRLALPGVAMAAVAPSSSSAFHSDGTEGATAAELVAWLEKAGRYIRPILAALPDGTIVRTEEARAPKVNAQFDRAGRHPAVQTAVRGLIASSPATEVENERG